MDNTYWNSVWDMGDIEQYRRYIAGFDHLQNSMIAAFREKGAHKVCDAACGFGAISLALYSNGFEVYGFDIAEEAVRITSALLSEYGLRESRFKQASILDTGYADGEFDAVAAKAVLDHLSCDELCRALRELKRITQKGGLLYASFDPLENDDVSLAHEVTPDGSFLYTDPSRAGLLFHYYQDSEIKALFSINDILLFKTDQRGNRHIIIQR